MGFDSSEPLLRAVEEDEVVGLIVQDPYKMGYLGVWHAVQHLEGHDVAPDGRKEFSTGEYVLTKENLHAAASRERYDPEAQSQRSIEVPTYPRRK
jgi:ribose transport system substrate-binding protein